MKTCRRKEGRELEERKEGGKGGSVSYKLALDSYLCKEYMECCCSC